MAKRKLPPHHRFPKGNRIWRLMWFGDVHFNPSVPTEPTIEVLLSPLINSETPIADVDEPAAYNYSHSVAIEVGIGYLPSLRIGTFWHNGLLYNFPQGKPRYVNATIHTPDPQFAGAVNVLDSNDRSRYNALEVQLSRRITRGFGFQVSYTLAKSKDTRSFDPTFAIANRGAAQSSANTPFDIRNRELNYAPSDFDRRHALQGYTVAELPFGKGHRFANNLNPVLDRIIGGFEFATIVRLYSGRPFTVYSGVNTLTNVVQTPANCNGCSRNLGRITLENNQNVFFTADQRAKFSAPAPGEFSNTGRNYFRGPSLFNMDVTLSKRIRFTESRNLEFRLEAQNATNTPSFDFPVANISSTSFGIVGSGVVSASRKVQFALKFNF